VSRRLFLPQRLVYDFNPSFACGSTARTTSSFITNIQCKPEPWSSTHYSTAVLYSRKGPAQVARVVW